MNKKRRPDRGPVGIRCQVCGWVSAQSTWRPAKRELRAHTARHVAQGIAV